ncbi:MAG TPA: tetratricopeptide repeat protein [Sandaracinaceae bacterium LLY-WYZ-13_1]|nr:tetratricopeptide repeat protein [Sandaracinaceae bacterium LLY-WYZ-13_1]
MNHAARSLAPLLLVASLAACGGPSTGVEHGGSGASAPEVTDETFHEIERAYWSMDPDDPARIVYRDALVAHLSQRSDAILARGDYDTVVEHLARLTELLRPEDLAAGSVPEGVAPLAEWVVEHGSPRGDEGRVMGALLLLAELGRDPEARRAERERIAEWGRGARSGIENPIERYGDLIRVWEQHEQIAPAPEVLDTLARLYVEQRDALVGAFGPEGQGSRAPGRLSFQQLRLAPLLVQRAPLDVAAVYLRHGDLSQAIEHVRRMGDESGVEWRLLQVLERAQESGGQGAQALEELAQGFAQARPAISESICHLGVRRFPEDPRFPLCLARVAIEQDEGGVATSWYAEAVRLAPDDREVYDEALGRLDEMMEAGLFEADVSQSRSIGRHALHILEERRARWPDEPISVTREELLLQLGRAEMSAGNVAEARERLTASLQASETREGHIALGLLLERTASAEEAARHYRRALDMVTAEGAEGAAERAELLEHLGDAFRQAGDARQAERMYRQGLRLWGDLLEQVQGPRRSVVLVRRGVLHSRLGDAPAAEEAFAAAMEAAPSWREPYAAILAHLVVSQPNLELAQRVLRRATYQLTLEPEWRVYFALWVQSIAGRASAEPEGEVSLLLRDMARGDDWSARLAAYGRQELSYAELREAASNVGERAEAAFYEGARRLGSGDVAGARTLFEEVLETGMVSFYEYAMAQELLRDLPGGDPEVAAEATP